MIIANNIKNIIVEQIDAYRRLLDLLHREKECLVNLNAAGIEKLLNEKDTVVLRLRLLEEERVRLIGKFSQDNRVPRDMSMKILYDITKDDSFHVLRLQLVSLVQSISELSEFNKILIERSINFVKNSTYFLDLLGLNASHNNSRTIFSMEV
jgi:hypothetical protein